MGGRAVSEQLGTGRANMKWTEMSGSDPFFELCIRYKLQKATMSGYMHTSQKDWLSRSLKN